MEKEKKIINVLRVFFIFHKSNVKTFLKWILKQCHTALVNTTLYLNTHFLFLNNIIQNQQFNLVM